MNKAEQIERAIEHIDEVVDKLGCSECATEHIQLKNWLLELMELRKEKEEREKNEPLTLEQLEGMVGEPVWCKIKNREDTICGIVVQDYRGYSLLNDIYCNIRLNKETPYKYYKYKKESE